MPSVEFLIVQTDLWDMEIKNLREIYFKDTKSEIKPLKFRNKWSLDVSLDMCISLKRLSPTEVSPRYSIDCWIVFREFHAAHARYEIPRSVV